MTFFPPEFLDFIKPSLPVFNEFWQIFKIWWWFFLPFLLWPSFLYLYRYWRQDVWNATIKRVLLEIKIPKEVLKPIRAMEHVFAGFHGIHDIPIWREKWIEGQFQLSYSLEIISIEGEVHFYIRCPEMYRKVVESNIYSQYPEAEIFEAEDYTKKLPQDIPNKDWDIFGMDLKNTNDDPYPLKTYVKFESEREALEEKRVDPLAGLLEGMTVFGPGEQLWLQILAKPILNKDKPWVTKGEKIRDKLAKRPEKPVPKPLFQEAAEILISGPPKEEPKEKELIPPEMKLTPGEKEIIQAIEEKISKFGFDCCVRYVYLGKKDVFFKPRTRLPYGFFKAISTQNLNGLMPDKRTMTKVKSVFFWFLDKRKLFFKKRRMFKRYYNRMTPFFPLGGGTYVLNTEELATLYHFPGRAVAPAPFIPRIEAKKGEAPPGLPIE